MIGCLHGVHQSTIGAWQRWRQRWQQEDAAVYGARIERGGKNQHAEPVFRSILSKAVLTSTLITSALCNDDDDGDDNDDDDADNDKKCPQLE